MTNIIAINNDLTPLCIYNKEYVDILSIQKKGSYINEYLFQMNDITHKDVKYDMKIIENDGYNIIIFSLNITLLELHVKNKSELFLVTRYVNIGNIYLEKSNEELQLLLSEFNIIIPQLEKKISINKNISKDLPRIYRYKYYLDANHAVYIDGELGEIHPHTWEFTIELKHLFNKFISFSNVEKIIKEMLNPYQAKFINEITPFNEINPTTENIGEYFKNYINGAIKDENWKLLKLESSESPTRTYILKLD